MKVPNSISIALISITVFVSAGLFLIPKVLSEGNFLTPYSDVMNIKQLVFSEKKIVATKQLPQIEDAQITLAAVGDIMLSRTVATKINEHGINYPFEKTAEYLKNADLTFGNLETPITPGRTIRPFEVSFRADPATVEGLLWSGFDILSLANNHTPNFGQQGLLNTFSALDDAEISYVGAGADKQSAVNPVYLTRGGITLGFLAFNDTDVVPPDYGAANDRAGTALMDTELMISLVKQAEQYADHVIVSMHSGTEYVYVPNRRQIDFAHAAIDAGAELVIGHHPHVVQSMEVYRDKLIFYSLGNFVFDQMWSQPTREGMIALFTLTKKGGVTAIELTPVRIDDYAQPQMLTEEQGMHITERLQIPSDLIIPVTFHHSEQNEPF